MLRKVFYSDTFLSALVAILYTTLAIPLAEAVAFTPPADAAARHFMYLVKFIFLLFAFCFIRLIFYFVRNRKKLSIFSRHWIQYAILSFSILFIVFLLIYPGHWVWDEFNILNAVKHYQPDAWQNIFTNIYYTICLYIYPTGVSIVFLQIVIIAIISGYILATVRKYVTNPWATYALLLLFLSPVVIINDLYPLRLTLYSYMELTLFTLIVDSYLDKNIRKNNFLFVISSFLIMVLCLWRAEGIIYILLLPVAAYRFSIISGVRKQTPLAIICLILGLSILLGGYAVNKHYSSSRYALTAIINPLSIMLQSPLKGSSSISDLQKINEVLDIKMIREQASYTEVPSYWNGAVRNDFEQHLSGFYSAYFRIVLNNLDLFFNARIKTFSATNGLDSTTPTPMSLLSYPAQFTADGQTVVDRFIDTNIAAHPISYTVRYNLSRFLLMFDSKDHISIIGRVVWSIIPTITLLLALTILFVIKRLWVLFSISVLLLTHAALVFLTAPAGYFMYYLPVYLCGYTLVILLGIHLYRRFPPKIVRDLSKLR